MRTPCATIEHAGSVTTDDDRGAEAALVAIARAGRTAGAPITVDDILDAAEGLVRLDSADPELVAGVLDATMGKYRPRGVVRHCGRVTGRTTESPSELSRSSAVAASHDADGGPLQPPHPATERSGVDRSSSVAHAERIAVDSRPEATSLGLQSLDDDSARERTIELLGRPGAAAGRTVPSPRPAPSTVSTGTPQRWSPPPRVRAGTPLAVGEIAAIVRPMLHDWDGVASRPRPARTGRVDLHRSVRRAFRRGGSLLPPEHRRPGRRRPQAFIVVDLSPSVRGCTSIAVTVAQVLARTSRNVRVFAATDRLTEVTSSFRRRNVTTALAGMVASGEVDPTVASDWGRVLSGLARLVAVGSAPRHVGVFGDGRSVGSRPGWEPLRRIKTRAASLRWATPEPRGAWALGSGEPQGYAEITGHMVTVRAVSDLPGLVGGSSRVEMNENHS